MSHIEREIQAAIRRTYTVPPRIARLARLADYDLWYGPLTGCEDCGADTLDACTCKDPYPGFASACREVGEWVANNVYTAYFDGGDYLSDREPQGRWLDADGNECDADTDSGTWYEPEDYYIVEPRDICDVLFGKELYSHLF